jgi:hypothetical protein
MQKARRSSSSRPLPARPRSAFVRSRISAEDLLQALGRQAARGSARARLAEHPFLALWDSVRTTARADSLCSPIRPERPASGERLTASMIVRIGVGRIARAVGGSAERRSGSACHPGTRRSPQ